MKPFNEQMNDLVRERTEIERNEVTLYRIRRFQSEADRLNLLKPG